MLLISELVTNAVVHAGTSVELECRYGSGAVYAEITDRHPARRVADRGAEAHGLGLQLVGALAKEWGINYRRDRKAVWFLLAQTTDPLTPGTAISLPVPPPAQPPARPARPASSPAPPPPRAALWGRSSAAGGQAWTSHAALSFLAEASDLLAGHTDEEQVASLAGQLLVPRFADWCAVWLRDDDRSRLSRLARVWHARESRIQELRGALAQDPPPDAPRALPGQAVPWRRPAPAPGAGRAEAEGAARGPARTDIDGEGEAGIDRDCAADGSGRAVGAVRCDLVVGGRTVGTLVLGRDGPLPVPDEALGLIEDFARRVALAVLAARRYTQQATISRVLQRGLLPREEMRVPGLDTALVYEPAGEGACAGGDFYDLLQLPDGRWRFALGDVCGSGPEAAIVTGLARPVLRLLAREGYSVPETLDRLNREVGEQARFLSVVYGELAFRGDLVDSTLTCAGHPLPLVRDAAGQVRTAALPQLLLGVAQQVSYESQSFTLHPGDTLLCVTDGVTERRCGRHLFDDADGLASHFADCAEPDARGIAERLRRAVYAFAPDLPDDDLAMLVLRAPSHPGHAPAR